MTATESPTVRERSRWIVLTLMGLALCVVVLNNSAMNVAIPALMRDLGADLTAVQWIIDSYSIVFAGLLIVAGVWSDRWGRKRLTLGGLAVFGAASVLAAFATSTAELIALRAVLGAAAAFVMPGTLAILLHTFDRTERPKAIAAWSGIAALGVALGPVLGGLMVDEFGWSAVFWLNVPLVVGVVVASLVVVRESADPAAPPTDVRGAVLSVLTIGALVFTVIELGAPATPSGVVVAGGLVAIVAAVAFVRRLRTAPHPLIEVSLLRDRRFAGAAVSNMLLFFGLAGALLVLTQRLQQQLGMSPFTAGLAVGPVALTVLAATAFSPAVAQRLGARWAVGAGMIMAAAGLLILGWWGHQYPIIVVALSAVGIGFGLATPVATSMLVASLPDDRASSGSAVNDTMQELGFALGVAVVGAVLNRVFQHRMPDASLHAALDRAAVEGTAVAEQAGTAFDIASASAMTIGALITLLAAAVAIRLLPGRAGTKSAP
ncbi:MFS transporter [Saccharomonospora sp. NPDC046836]|uniref:MFS transporter n=1 Tax=Saccharomonospora sp. NPDC046836 TaxID=3156921 RepID=UPI0033EBEBB8